MSDETEEKKQNHTDQKATEQQEQKPEAQTEETVKVEETIAEELLEERVEELEAKVEDLEDERENLEEEKHDIISRLERLQADFSNYRKRIKKEKQEQDLKARVELIADLLPVLDNFERALQSTEEDSDFKQGVDMIYRLLIDKLEKQGLETIDTVGESFDHRYHEAVMQVEETEEEAGIIVEEIQKGYILEDKVVRPAMVKVAS